MTQADDYPITIRRAKNGFVAEAASLGLSRMGADVNALEAEVREAVDEILAAYDRHGAKIPSLPSASLERGRSVAPRSSITGAMIALLAVIIISAPLMWGYQKLTRIMSTSIDNLDASHMLRSASRAVQKTADTLEAITPQRRDQLASDFGRIARALEPYAFQLRPLLVSSAPSDAQIAPGRKQP